MEMGVDLRLRLWDRGIPITLNPGLINVNNIDTGDARAPQQVLKIRERINRIIARETGQPLEQVERSTDRNFWLTADEALDYGLVGRIIESAAELP